MFEASTEYHIVEFPLKLGNKIVQVLVSLKGLYYEGTVAWHLKDI